MAFVSNAAAMIAIKTATRAESHYLHRISLLRFSPSSDCRELRGLNAEWTLADGCQCEHEIGGDVFDPFRDVQLSKETEINRHHASALS